MRCSLPAILLMLTLGAFGARAAYAHELSAQKLLEACEPYSDVCGAYVLGVVDVCRSSVVVDAEHKGTPSEAIERKHRHPAGWVWCMSPAVTIGQAGAVVAKFLRQNPEKWHMLLDSLVAGALSEAFPCSDSKAAGQ